VLVQKGMHIALLQCNTAYKKFGGQLLFHSRQLYFVP
jgi:hypothetical protein